ncbi:MAG: dCTP deaminase [Haloarculaceae archaeon]
MATDRDVAASLTDVVHAPTQREGRGFDLTLGAVERIERPGSVDFGGGELAPAETAPVETERRSPDDDYGWWVLDGGQYLFEHNESLTTDEPFFLQPRAELLARGASHPTLSVTSLDPLPLAVPDGGVRLKENARVSTLLPNPRA